MRAGRRSMTETLGMPFFGCVSARYQVDRPQFSENARSHLGRRLPACLAPPPAEMYMRDHGSRPAVHVGPRLAASGIAMLSLRTLSFSFALAAALGTAGCTHKEEHAQIDATINPDGYA